MKSKEYFDKLARSKLPSGYSLEKLRNVQKILANRVQEIDIVNPDSVNYVCGFDLAYIAIKNVEYAISTAIVYSINQGKIVDKAIVVTKTSFPYIPTLLSFREMKPIIMTYKRLKIEPEVLLIDGHGKAHPYRLGIASHIGVVLKKPTIGCAKSLLYGKLTECNDSICKIIDPVSNEVIGYAIEVTKNKYLYVSVGNLITIQSAIKIVKKLVKNSVMPIPILYAHNECNKIKRKLRSSGIVESFSIDKFLHE